MTQDRLPRICLLPALIEMLLIAEFTIAAAPSSSTFRVQIVAPEMCCNGCAQKVAGQLYALPGITSVQSDVPTRTVTISGKLAPKLTLERLWQAVEKGKGGPSKLVSPTATYLLTPAEKLTPDERLASGQYRLEVGTLNSNEDAQTIADHLYRVPGVSSVGVDVPRRKFAIQAAATPVISPWALVGAAERAQARPTAVAGQFGVFTIERAADAKPAATAQRDSQNPRQNQGETR